MKRTDGQLASSAHVPFPFRGKYPHTTNVLPSIPFVGMRLENTSCFVTCTDRVRRCAISPLVPLRSHKTLKNSGKFYSIMSIA